jgi:hypothetical protein
MALVALSNGQVVVGLTTIPLANNPDKIAEPGCMVVLNSKACASCAVSAGWGLAACGVPAMPCHLLHGSMRQ